MSQVQDPEDDPRKYLRLTAELRTKIDEGVLRPGEPVPSITVLAAERGWARQTCGRALRMLRDEGLLRWVPGLGYYVIGKGPSASYARGAVRARHTARPS
jgi:DNA-binding GntR family transcriptional regulator